MSISEDIRRLELELIDVETRLKNTGMLERSYLGLLARREIFGQATNDTIMPNSSAYVRLEGGHPIYHE
jgi:hypothetical protein